ERAARGPVDAAAAAASDRCSGRRDGAARMLIADRPGALTVRTFGRGEPGYPAGLFDLPDPPTRFCVWSPDANPSFETACAVAIVGARAATPYGLGIASRLARDLAVRGVTIVSGLAH